MAKSIMIQGTTSNAGKSFVVAGLCRIFKEDGYKVAPFKSQNMALNSYITDEGLEMGRAQVMQAEAAGVKPNVLMNPILLKPTSNTGSQVIVNGEVVGNMAAKEYFATKKDFIPAILEAYHKLEEEYDIIVIEGAGSPAEINLKSEDIVNMGMAKMAKAPVLVVGDVDKGGVFAALAGTMSLLEEEEQNHVKGVLINKFRGDKEILKPGLDMLEDIINRPVAGVLPYINVDVDDEDSLSDRFIRKSRKALIDIAVIRLPRISNFTDFNPFEYIDGVNLRYVGSVGELGEPDMIILPGTKNTMGDLLWLRQSGLEVKILRHAELGKPVFGICGGYQMLGTSLNDPHNIEHGGQMAGLGILDIVTEFKPEKIRTNADGVLSDVDGIFECLSGLSYYGYEIHMGVSDVDKNIINTGNVYGSYIHGVFDSADISKSIIAALMEAKGLDASNIKAVDINTYKEEQYDKLAKEMRENLDMDLIYKIVNEGV